MAKTSGIFGVSGRLHCDELQSGMGDPAERSTPTPGEKRLLGLFKPHVFCYFISAVSPWESPPHPPPSRLPPDQVSGLRTTKNFLCSWYNKRLTARSEQVEALEEEEEEPLRTTKDRLLPAAWPRGQGSSTLPADLVPLSRDKCTSVGPEALLCPTVQR